jgi:hypothetical protein
MHNTEGTSPEANNHVQHHSQNHIQDHIDHIQGRLTPDDSQGRQLPQDRHGPQEPTGPRPSDPEARVEWHDLRAICCHTIPSKPNRPARRCGSPALRGESFCYFHHPTRTPVRNLNERRARRIARQAFTITYPTTHAELQLVLRDLVGRLAAGQIDPRRAGQIIFALQTAAKGLP